ncbi:ribonuclease H-like domain-containing protein [Tanacetum coccineum]
MLLTTKFDSQKIKEAKKVLQSALINGKTLIIHDISHENFFNVEYPELPNDDERVDPNLNIDHMSHPAKSGNTRLNHGSQSDSNSSSEFGNGVNTADFPVNNYGNDVDSSDDIVATQNEEVATLEENIFSEGNMDSNPSTSAQVVQPVRREYYFEASKYPHWTDAMNQEMDALLRNGTWEIIKLSKDRKAIGSKWIHKIKYRSSGEINRYKARLVAHGFGQKEGIDYEETFSPVVKMSDKGVFLALLVYVDDIIITGNNICEIEKFKVYLKSKFMIKDLVKLKYFLGIKVIDIDKGICLNQRKYVLDLLSDYGMLACKPVKTPLISKLVISNEAFDSDPILEKVTNYQKLMGKLFYLTNTRPDISYVVHCLSQFMHSPLKSHLKITFKILRYLKGCPSLGIHIIKDSEKNTLSKSSTKAEYRALASVTTNPVFHERTKHLEIDLHLVREKILKGVVKNIKVESTNQIADIFTKWLDILQHKGFVEKLGMFDIYQFVVTLGSRSKKLKVGGLVVSFVDSQLEYINKKNGSSSSFPGLKNPTIEISLGMKDLKLL